MARKSKYNDAPQAQTAGKLWQTALYVRLSRDDGDKSESESIAAQKAYLLDYIKAHDDLAVFRIYADDGWSGTDFDRPQFSAMLEDIQAGRVNCVLVKDLSRFGRNYIEAGHYLESYFPLRRIRFIAVNDCIDSVENPASVENVIVPMKNVMNDEYCRDISQKVRSSLNTRRAQGKFIGSFASYGYRKDPADHNRLLIDDEAAEVVREIFRRFLGGESVLGIARRLNELGVPNPSAYKRAQGMRYRHPADAAADGYWPDSSVRRILKNELYTGVMVQGRNRTVSYKVHLSRAVEPGNWIRVEGTHEPIIAREVFDRAQLLFARDTRTAPGERRVDLFAGFLRCADCGRAMNKKTISQPGKKYCYYICSTFKKASRDACTKHTIRSDALENAVLVTIQKQIELAVQMDELIRAIGQSGLQARASDRLGAALSLRRKERRSAQSVLLDLYPDYKSGFLSRESYLALKEREEAKLSALDESIAALEAQLAAQADKLLPEDGFPAAFLRCQNVTALSRELLLELVDHIDIREGGGIDIHFRFSDSFETAAAFIRSNRHLLTA